MKRFQLFFTSVVLVALFAAPGAQAQMVRHSGGADGNLVILRELGVVAGPKEGTTDLEVVTLLPDAAGKSDVTIERGDLILMIGGKRIRELAQLRELYDGAEVGETLKLGFRRGDERFLVSFDKQEEQAGEMRMVMMGGPGEGGEMHPLMEFGVVLNETDGMLTFVMEMHTERLAITKDDLITSDNGKAIDSLAMFREIYEAAEIGDELDLIVSRGDEEINVSRTKEDMSGMMRVRTATH
jgi:S1-C subfamily serine protease